MNKNIFFTLLFFITLIGCSDDINYPTIIDQVPNLPEGYTHVPDDRFEQILIDLGYDKTDSIPDDMVLTENIQVIKALDIDSAGIYKLDGIEDFSSLEFLSCSWNQLEKLDLSNNKALKKLVCKRNRIYGNNLKIDKNYNLTYLDCTNGKIASLDLTEILDLDTLYCGENRISSLDLSKNKKLRLLTCTNNMIPKLEVNQNKELLRMECYGNPMTELSLSNPKLQYLGCFENNLKILDLSQCPALLQVDCFMNELNTIYFAENNNLRSLSAGYNNFESIDLSDCSRLLRLDLKINKLKTINIRNGNNHRMKSFFVIKNPDLKCIQVDDVAWSIANWTDVDKTAIFSGDCSL